MYSIWAVARNTIAQAVRMKVAVIVIVLLVILLPLMSVIMVGDGTLEGKLQTFISYGLSLTTWLLCLLTIAVSSYTLTNDVKRNHIHLVVTKPIRRFQILCGKLLGIIIIDVFLLAVFSGVIYGLTLSIPRLSDADEAELANVKREFFTARESLSSDVDEEKIDLLARQAYQKLELSRQLPETMTKNEVLAELRGRERARARAVEPGGQRVWEFENIRPAEPNETVFVRYKYEVSVDPPDYRVYGTWLVGDYRQVQYGLGNWDSPIARTERSELIRQFHEFEVSAEVVADDGFLAVIFANNPYQNSMTIIPQEVQVLLKTGSFTGNYIRVVLLILVRLIFLAALGISVSTWLSFPVAILVCTAVFFVGTINGFVVESFGMLTGEISVLYYFTLKPLLWLLPRFDGAYNPTQFMVSASILSWQFLGKIYMITVLLKSVLLFLFGVWIFSNREIGKVIV
ncbi:MAG: hypothetical protein ACYTFK_01405 [Planctomycetota bacterium]|jgi:hypothetical protein